MQITRRLSGANAYFKRQPLPHMGPWACALYELFISHISRETLRHDPRQRTRTGDRDPRLDEENVCAEFVIIS